MLLHKVVWKENQFVVFVGIRIMKECLGYALRSFNTRKHITMTMKMALQ